MWFHLWWPTGNEKKKIASINTLKFESAQGYLARKISQVKCVYYLSLIFHKYKIVYKVRISSPLQFLVPIGKKPATTNPVWKFPCKISLCLWTTFYNCKLFSKYKYIDHKKSVSLFNRITVKIIYMYSIFHHKYDYIFTISYQGLVNFLKSANIWVWCFFSNIQWI